jgi:type IV secretory pathway TrbF-like protein
MWFKKVDKRKTEADKPELPGKVRYTKYYEHDGALRSYANRAMVLAFLCVPTALLAVALAAYVRIQPPTVIRVDPTGEASLLGRSGKPSPELAISVTQGSDAAPTDFEKRAFVRLFLERWLDFSPVNVANNWAESLNMMTTDQQRLMLNALKSDNTVGKIQQDQTSSLFHLRLIEPSKEDPLTFTVYGVKEVHRVREHNDEATRTVGEFHIRLVSERRSEQNPSGLLVAEYWEREIEGTKRDAILHDTALQPPQ